MAQLYTAVHDSNIEGMESDVVLHHVNNYNVALALSQSYCELGLTHIIIVHSHIYTNLGILLCVSEVADD